MRRYLLGAMSGQQRGAGAAALRILLAQLALVNSGLHKSRPMLCRGGLLRSLQLPGPVISVGNLTTGGTGKTPFVEMLARRLAKRNLRVAILARGYGRTDGGR